MPRRVSADAVTEVSPLRQARLARNWTLEQAAEHCDLVARDGRSGVTASMISGWELGRHVTSFTHRETLHRVYGEPVEVLFAHQDRALGSHGAGPRLLTAFPQLREAMVATVVEARQCLVVTGSRSRDGHYLEAIEAVLADRPELVHYRVLFGPPHHTVLREHLLRLLELRDPADRSLGVQTLHLGVVEDPVRFPERFITASERQAVVPIPSLTAATAFDSGVVLDAAAARRLLDHGRQVYAGARRIESPELVEELPVVRERVGR